MSAERNPDQPQTLAQMLAANLGAALRGEITAEQAQANADAWREQSEQAQ